VTIIVLYIWAIQESGEVVGYAGTRWSLSAAASWRKRRQCVRYRWYRRWTLPGPSTWWTYWHDTAST